MNALLERVIATRAGGSLYWRLKWQSFAPPKGRPDAAKHNGALRSRHEWEESIEQIKRLGLPVYSDMPKNWDSLAALDCILARTKPDDPILDAGSVVGAVILPWLALYGYRNLHGNNIAQKRRMQVGPISYAPGDVTKT